MRNNEQPPKINFPDFIPIDDSTELRLITLTDTLDFYKLALDQDVHKYLPWAQSVNSLNDTEFVINRFIKENQQGFSYRYGIFLEKKLIGYIGIWKDKLADNCMQTGTALISHYRGQGLANKCRKGIEQVAWLNGINRLASYVSSSNTASVRMLNKTGYVDTGISNEQDEKRYEKILSAE